MAEDRTTARWHQRQAAILKTPGLHTIYRPLSSEDSLPLTYTRSLSTTQHPILLLPGGPGLASVVPYRRLRTRAEKGGLDLIMVEHRGIGMSRRTARGIDVPSEDVTLNEVLADLEAVLDAEGLGQVILCGSSYGSYLAAAFGLRYPDRVAGMVLDSAMIDAAGQKRASERLNQLYWHGTPDTRRHADRVQALATSGALDPATAGFPVQTLHEAGGPDAVAAMLDLLDGGKGGRVWRWIQKLGSAEVMTDRPFLMEFDLVGRIAFTELHYGAPHDPIVGPLRTDTVFGELSARYPPFAGERFDLRAALPGFEWPVFVLTGDRDIRTPPSVAEEIARLAPQTELLRIAAHGHSALDTAQALAIQTMQQIVALLAAGQARLGTQSSELIGSPSPIASLLNLRLRAARLLPRVLS